MVTRYQFQGMSVETPMVPQKFGFPDSLSLVCPSLDASVYFHSKFPLKANEKTSIPSRRLVYGKTRGRFRHAVVNRGKRLENSCRKYEILEQRKYRAFSMVAYCARRKCVTRRGENSIAPSSYPGISAQPRGSHSWKKRVSPRLEFWHQCIDLCHLCLN